MIVEWKHSVLPNAPGEHGAAGGRGKGAAHSCCRGCDSVHSAQVPRVADGVCEKDEDGCKDAKGGDAVMAKRRKYIRKAFVSQMETKKQRKEDTARNCGIYTYSSPAFM
jgi:hypothetical protein